MAPTPWRDLRIAATALSAVVLLGGCAVAERDAREDLRDAMKTDMRLCGTDTECLRKRQAARSGAARETAPGSGAGRSP